MIDRLYPFLGLPVPFGSAHIYSPKIKDIAKVGQNVYHFYLLFATFNANKLFGVLGEDFVGIGEEVSNFELLACDFTGQLCESLAFFVGEEVQFDTDTKSFRVESGIFLDNNSHKEFVDIIMSLNGLSEEKTRTPKFRNKKAKELYEKQQKYEAEKRARNALELKDMLSILCGAPDNGINVFNVGDLNIYQVYEHWERLNLKESHSRLIGVWQNGFLDDPNKLQEWMVKTKL